MAERVVHGLEPVELDQQQRRRKSLLPGSRKGGARVILERGAIGQAGERIVERQVLDALLEFA